MTRPLTVYQSPGPPIAFTFFNPTTDLLGGGSSALPSFRSLNVPTGQEPIQATQPLRRPGSLPRRDFSLPLPTPSPILFSPRLQSHFGATGVHEPSPLTHAVGAHDRLAGMWVDIVILHFINDDGYRFISISWP